MTSQTTPPGLAQISRVTRPIKTHVSSRGDFLRQRAINSHNPARHVMCSFYCDAVVCLAIGTRESIVTLLISSRACKETQMCFSSSQSQCEPDRKMWQSSLSSLLFSSLLSLSPSLPPSITSKAKPFTSSSLLTFLSSPHLPLACISSESTAPHLRGRSEMCRFVLLVPASV